MKTWMITIFGKAENCENINDEIAQKVWESFYRLMKNYQIWQNCVSG
jgi:hypothetical protein